MSTPAAAAAAGAREARRDDEQQDTPVSPIDPSYSTFPSSDPTSSNQASSVSETMNMANIVMANNASHPGHNRPELTVTAAAINDEPIELDSTPASSTMVSLQEHHQQLSAEETERRQKLISERQTDPAVLVDIPQTPGPEEFGKSEERTG